MRQLPASYIKAGKRGPKIKDLPGSGTNLRKLYDMFMTNQGRVIAWHHRSWNSRNLDDLRDYHGLDIRRVGKGKWLLAGEWCGKVYVDYVAK